jgi:HEAT repeat protein/beta-lactamase regulating signal transducer with metallopeptidase domain
MVRISEFILNFALNAWWQIAAIFAVAALGSLLLKNGPAQYRHTLWLFALAACLFAPLLTATGFLPQRLSTFQTVAPQAKVSTVAKLDHAGPTTSQVANEDPALDLVGRRSLQTINTSPNIAVFLTLVYVLFLAGRGIRLARFWRRKERLRRSATVEGLAPEIEIAAERCRRLLGIGDVALTRSREARVPYTLGARRPLIVLPEVFCSDVDENKLLSVIGHEMAHVKRRDFLSNLICELLVLPISFHPLAFLIKRQIGRARELACDELVTKDVLEPKVYARSLLWAADVSRQYSPQAFMLSIFDGKILEERIVRLMRNKRRVASGPARVMMCAALLFVGGAALSLSMFSLELQTAARARVLEPVQMLSIPITQDPVAPAAATAQSRTEPQLNAPAADERAMSACRTGRRGDTEAIPSLIAMLGDDTKTELIKCWDSGRWSPALQTFKHPSPGEQAAIALASFGRPAFVPLMNQLDSSNATVRRNAAWAIGELTNMLPGQRSGAVPQLISLLRDSDEWVRMAAARALGELRDERALEQLVGTLSDDNWRVRQLVVWALSEMKDARAVMALCNVLLSDTRVEVRRGAAEALGEIGSAEALPSLKQALNDAEAGVSAKVAWAISEIEG